MSSWDFFHMGRIAILGESNIFTENSELTRTGSVPSAPLQGNNEIQSIAACGEDLGTPWTSESQLRPAAPKRDHKCTLLCSSKMLQTSKLCKLPSMIKEGSHVDIIDINPHAGDKLIATQVSHCRLQDDYSVFNKLWNQGLSNGTHTKGYFAFV